MNQLLIFTYKDDPHSKVVCDYLWSIGASYFLVDTNEVHNKYSFKFRSKSLEYQILNKESGNEIMLDDSWNIWNRILLDLNLSEVIPKDFIPKIIKLPI